MIEREIGKKGKDRKKEKIFPLILVKSPER